MRSGPEEAHDYLLSVRARSGIMGFMLGRKSGSFRVLAFLGAWPATRGGEVFFRRGDANQDGILDISDSVKVLNVLFLGDPSPGCDAALDLNGDGAVDISDGIYGLGFLFN